jgi:hypothetical protein
MEGYINILEGSRPMLGCPIGYMEGSMYLTGHPGMALDPYVMSMYPTGYHSFALDPYM